MNANYRVDFRSKVLHTPTAGTIQFREIAVSEIRELTSPHLIIKNQNKLFCVPVPEDITWSQFEGAKNSTSHKCCTCKNMFTKSKPTGTYDGMCPKVANVKCNNIQSYEFITRGFEAVHVSAPFLVVLACCNS